MINSDELLLVVDEHNNPLQSKPRKAVHADGDWHRTTHIWIINDKKQILCQKRSLLKDCNPGKWESFFGGHMAPDVDYVTGALAEVNEELSLGLTEKDLNFFMIYKAEQSKEFLGIYYAVWNGDVKNVQFEKEEIDEIDWVHLSEVKKFVVEQKDAQWSIQEYEEELVTHLEN